MQVVSGSCSQLLGSGLEWEPGGCGLAVVVQEAGRPGVNGREIYGDGRLVSQTTEANAGEEGRRRRAGVWHTGKQTLALERRGGEASPWAGG